VLAVVGVAIYLSVRKNIKAPIGERLADHEAARTQEAA
jgi:hypothetical protein